MTERNSVARDAMRLSFIVCTLLVLLRLSIGWHVLYEGLAKLTTMGTANPWTAAPYLKNAQGPFRDFFRGIAGDPYELRWLDYDGVASNWDAWQQRFLSHIPDLSDRARNDLDRLLNGPEAFYASLDALPPGIEFRGSIAKAIRFEPDQKRLVVDGKWHLTPSERDRLIEAVDELAEQGQRDFTDLEKKFKQAVQDIYKRSARLSFKERLAVLLRGDPDRAGPSEWLDGKIVAQRLGEIELYQRQVARYETGFKNSAQGFETDHLARQSSDLEAQRAQLIGPVQALDAALKQDAQELLTTEQLALGPVPEPWTELKLVNMITMWGLTITGALLIAGLFTRLSALGAAVLIVLFYLAMPPWPGLPQPPGPEKSLIINKNLIEAIALFCFAVMPTGQWFGIDAVFRRKRSRK